MSMSGMEITYSILAISQEIRKTIFQVDTAFANSGTSISNSKSITTIAKLRELKFELLPHAGLADSEHCLLGSLQGMMETEVYSDSFEKSFWRISPRNTRQKYWTAS